MKSIDVDDRIPIFRGTPQDVGIKYATINKTEILNRYNLWLNDCFKHGLSETDLIDRSAQYVAVAQEITPWLLEEAKAIAGVLEVPSGLFISSVALQKLTANMDVPSSDDECTSIIAVGNATKNGESILHKNRDNNIGVQSVYEKEIIYKGKALNRFIGTSYVYDFGTNAFINDKGIAGAVNAGEPYPNPSRGGLTTSSILRLIAEKASCCEDVLEIIIPIISRYNYYFHNQNRGSIWLFVDKNKGLIIENTAHVVAFEYIYNDIAVRANDFLLLDKDYAVGKLGNERPGGLVRREKTLRRLQSKNGSIIPETIIGAARDWEPPVNTSQWTKEEVEAYLFSNICKSRTISGFTGVSRKNYTDVLSYARVINGHPNNVYSVPIYLGCESLLLPHINGELSMISYQLAESNPIGENQFLNIDEKEKEISRKMNILERKVIDLLNNEKKEEAKEVITKNCNEISQWTMHLMRSVVKKLK